MVQCKNKSLKLNKSLKEKSFELAPVNNNDEHPNADSQLEDNLINSPT